MKARKRYFLEFRERAASPVEEMQKERSSEWKAINSPAEKLDSALGLEYPDGSLEINVASD